MTEAEQIVAEESRRVVLEALTVAYQDIHATLDLRQPSAERMSRTLSALAVALRTMGSSGGEALGV